MKNLKLTLGGALFFFLPALSLAEGYFGVNYVQMEQHDRFYGEGSFDTGDVMLRLGANINPYWVMELRAGTTASPKRENGLEFKHNYFYGALARFQYPMGPFTPYLGAGYSQLEESISTDTSSSEARIDDYSFAVGVDVELGQSFGLELEYFMLSDENQVARRGPSAGFFYTF